MNKVNQEKAQTSQEVQSIVIELSGLQRTLREAVAEKMKSEQLTTGSLASRLGIAWKDVKHLVEGGRGISSPRLIKALTGYIKRADLAQRLDQLFTALNHSSKYVGATVLPVSAIELVFALQDKWEKSGLLRGEFAAAFGSKLEVTLADALAWKHVGTSELTDERQGPRVLEILTSAEFGQRLAAVQGEKKRLMESAVQDMDTLLARLKSKYGSFDAASKALQLDPSTLYRAHNLDPHVSLETVRGINAKAKELLSGTEDGARSKTPPPKPEPERAKADLPQTAPSAQRHKHMSATSRMLRDNAGETTPDGIKFVLTSDSFQMLDFSPGGRGLVFTKKQLQLSRALLNILCQIMRPETREMVKEQLSGEIEELEYAIRLFSSEYPNNLLPLQDAARMSMVEKRLAHKGKGKGK
ncbi:MAG: hypothetical protein WC641_06130 [Patescibacteria group bacterium]